MASIDIDLIINASQSANTLKDTRASLKAIKSAMLEVGDDSKEFNRLAAAAADLGDRVDDVNQRLKSFNPDGFAALTNFASKAAGAVSLVTGAMGLFGEQSEDVQKALMKVQSAMAFAQGLDAVKGLKAAFKDLWATIMANPIAAIVAALAALAISGLAVYDAMMATSDATKKLNAEYEKQQKVTAEIVREQQRNVELLEAQGASEEEIIAAKKKLIEAQITELETSNALHESKLRDIKTNDSLWESIVRYSGAIKSSMGDEKAADTANAVIAQNKKERADEELKLLEENKQTILDLRNSLLVLDAEQETKAREAFKSNLDETEKLEKESLTRREQNHINYLKAKRAEEEKQHDEQKQRFADEQAALAQNAEDWQVAIDEVNAAQQAAYEDEAKRAEEKKKRDELVRKSALEGTASLFNSLSQLAGKNAKLQKAFAVGEATINTYKGVTNALAQPLPVPINLINAAAILAAGIANVKKILSVDTTGSSSGGGLSGGGTGGAFGGVSAVNTEPAQPQQPTTQLNQTTPPNSNSQTPLMVYVLESDITVSQNQMAATHAAVTFR